MALRRDCLELMQEQKSRNTTSLAIRKNRRIPLVYSLSLFGMTNDNCTLNIGYFWEMFNVQRSMFNCRCGATGTVLRWVCRDSPSWSECTRIRGQADHRGGRLCS